MVDVQAPAIRCMEELCAAIASMGAARGIGLIAEARSRLAAVEAGLLASQIPPGGGTRDAEETLIREGRHSKQAARRTAERASTITTLPDVGEQLAAGTITAEHVDAVSEAIRRTSAEAVTDAPELVTEIAELPVDKARVAAREWADAQIDDATAATREQRQRRRRRARMFDTSKGMIALYAEFDPTTGASVRGALTAAADAAYRADGGRDLRRDHHPRTLDQRMADVLAAAITGADAGGAAEGGAGTPAGDAGAVESAANATADETGESTPGAADATSIDANEVRNWYRRRSRPEVIVTTDLETLLRLTSGTRGGNADPPEERPATSATPTELHPAAPPAGKIAGGPPISRHTLDRLACHSEFAVLLFGQSDRPLAMGRKVRLATPAQFEALVARDRGCVMCGGHWQTTIAHHLTPWSAPARGRTDIDNLALVCEHSCHHHLHDNDLTLIQVDGRWVTRPALPEERPAQRPPRPQQEAA